MFINKHESIQPQNLSNMSILRHATAQSLLTIMLNGEILLLYFHVYKINKHESVQQQNLLNILENKVWMCFQSLFLYFLEQKKMIQKSVVTWYQWCIRVLYNLWVHLRLRFCCCFDSCLFMNMKYNVIQQQNISTDEHNLGIVHAAGALQLRHRVTQADRATGGRTQADNRL